MLPAVFIVNLVFATLTASPATLVIEERMATNKRPGKMYLELILAVKEPDPCNANEPNKEAACKAACPNGGSCEAVVRFLRKHKMVCKCTGSKTLREAWAEKLSLMTDIPSVDTPCTTHVPCEMTCTCLIRAGGAAACVNPEGKRKASCYCASAEAVKLRLFGYLLWLPQYVAIQYWRAPAIITHGGTECGNTHTTIGHPKKAAIK